MNSKISISSFFVLLSLSLFSQTGDYAELMNDSAADYSKIQQAFEASWNGRDHKVKGKGWKAFKRFEYQHQNQLLVLRYCLLRFQLQVKL